MGFTLMDSIYQLFVIGVFLLIPIILIFIAVKLFRRYEKRAEARLTLEKDNKAFQLQQKRALKDINERLTNIENTLKEVE